MWQWLLAIRVAEKALVLLHEHRGCWIGKSAPAEHDPHGAGDVMLELGLGDTRHLEILPVEVGDAALTQQLERLAAAAERRRHAETRDSREDVGTEQRRMPGDWCAPVVADDHRLALAERLHQADYVADGVEDRIGRNVGRA